MREREKERERERERTNLGRRNIEKAMAEKFPKSMNNINPLIQAENSKQDKHTKTHTPKKIQDKTDKNQT